MSNLPIRCPVCEGPMNVLVYYCPECDVTVEGEICPPGGSSPKAQ